MTVLPVTVEELVAEARSALARAPFRPSSREALLLVGRVLGWSEAQVLARGEQAVPPPAAERLRALLGRRLTGEPVAYLFGEKEFWGRSFRVDRRVLIPRPETEHLVEAVLASKLPPAPRVLDVGVGSGCLAVTLALELPNARVWGTDISLGALAVTAANARRHRAPVRLVAADLVAGLDLAAFDLVVSNPPYVGRREAGELSQEVRDFEPEVALFAERGGTAVIRRLLAAGRGLRAGGRLVLEIGHQQLDAVTRAAAGGPLTLAEIRRDYAGIPRVVVLDRRPPEEPHGLG